MKEKINFKKNEPSKVLKLKKIKFIKMEITTGQKEDIYFKLKYNGGDPPRLYPTKNLYLPLKENEVVFDEEFSKWRNCPSDNGKVEIIAFCEKKIDNEPPEKWPKFDFDIDVYVEYI